MPFKHINTLYTLAAGLVFLSVILVYQAGLHGGFVFDDFNNLVYNERLQAVEGLHLEELKSAAFSSEASQLKRPVSMLSFALNHAFSGMNPYAFKLTNLLIHVLTGVGVYLVALLLSRSLPHAPGQTARSERIPAWIALLVAAMWLLHPLQLTSVLYVVQRMASLAALFMFWGMAAYAYGRYRQIRGQSGRAWILSAYIVFLPLAAFSKENGFLLPALLLLIEVSVFRLAGLDRRGQAVLKTLHLVCAVLPIALISIYLVIKPDWILRSYSNRDFDLAERLLTQARALWFYLSLIAVPDISRMGLYHDDFIVSTSLRAPWSTLPALVALGFLTLLCLVFMRRWSVLAFSVLFFLTAHALESSFFGLELVHEHRNYVAIFGPLFGLSWLIYRVQQSYPDIRRVTVFAAIGGLVLLSGTTAMRANDWSDDLRRALVDAENHPHSPRARMDAGLQLVRFADQTPNPDHYLRSALAHLQHADRLDTYGSNAMFGILITQQRLGEASADELFQRLAERLRTPPLASVSPDALVNFIQCNAIETCSFDVDRILYLIQAISENPAARPIDLSRIYTEIVQLFIQRNDVDNALVFAAMAADLSPHQPQLRLNLAAVLLISGQPEEALFELYEARRLDHDSFHQNRISALENQIRHRMQTGLNED